jgi:hypothetical protein
MNDELLSVPAPLKQVFEVLQRAKKPTLQFVVASYYKLMPDFPNLPADSACVRTFKWLLKEYMDAKFYTSIKAFYWVLGGVFSGLSRSKVRFGRYSRRPER